MQVVNRKSVTFNAEKDQPPTPTSPSSLRQAQSQSWPADNQRSNSKEDGKYEEEERRTLASLQAKVSCTEAQSPVQAQAHPQTHFQTQTRGGHAALPCPDTPRPGHRPHIPQVRGGGCVASLMALTCQRCMRERMPEGERDKNVWMFFFGVILTSS